MKKVIIVFVVSILCTFISGCPVDDQTIIRPSEQHIANPEMSTRNFEEINASHKILMAIMDSGVDYNHPYLINNIHSLKANIDGKTRWTSGYDFLGQDFYPYPLIIRTAIHDPRKDTETIKTSMARHCINRAILSIEPSFSNYIHPMRDENAEDNNVIGHGTHVAGLMVYDRPDFGLIPYRLLPQTTRGKLFDYQEEFTKHFRGAVEHANASGVKIINLSLGSELAAPVENDDHETFEENRKKFFDTVANYLEREKIIKSHPDMLFIAAAGNSSKWSDGSSLLQSPCGVNASNMLCVGSVNSSGDLSSFTNIPLNNVDLVFAIGENLKSLYPGERCMGITEKLTNIYNDVSILSECTHSKVKIIMTDDGNDIISPSNPIEPSKYLVKDLKNRFGTVIQESLTECNRERFFAAMSGTSMASPIIAHLAAEILSESPGDLTPQEIIKNIYERATSHNLGRLSVYKLKIKKPSWLVSKNLNRFEATDSSFRCISPELCKFETDENRDGEFFTLKFYRVND